VAKVVVKTLKSKASRKSSGHSVVEKRFTDSEGHRKTLRKLDAGSKSFGDDLQYVFRKNVGEARRENKRLLGVPDFVPNKG
jgi:hypothetical protein